MLPPPPDGGRRVRPTNVNRFEVNLIICVLKERTAIWACKSDGIDYRASKCPIFVSGIKEQKAHNTLNSRT